MALSRDGASWMSASGSCICWSWQVKSDIFALGGWDIAVRMALWVAYKCLGVGRCDSREIELGKKAFYHVTRSQVCGLGKIRIAQG